MTQNGPSPKPPTFGGLLFRTLGNDEGTNEPLAFGEEASPFAPAPTSGAVTLTVADVLPQLPPDLARATSIAQDQPVQISPSVLNQALSSGQLAIPLFEVYRVCPGIFRSPVSPDDTRMVQLPPSKLSSFVTLAASTPAPNPGVPNSAHGQTPTSLFTSLPSFSQPPASPFTQPAAASPFGTLFDGVNDSPAPKPGATQLPPRRDSAQPPAMSIPPTPPFQVASPFSAGPETSPFGTPAASAPPSPFPSQPVSPFAFAPATPEAVAPSANPFGSAEPLKPSPFAPAPPPQTAVEPPATKPSAPSGPALASVSSLLKGQQSDDLGFDPAMVPSWINTQFHGGIVADLQTMDEPKIELGAIVDGITDVGFRNVLHSAQRNHLIPISLEELTPVQPAGSPSEVPSTATPPPVVHRVEPPASTANHPSDFGAPPALPSEPPAPFLKIEPGNPFAHVPEAPPAEPAAPENEPPAPPPAATHRIQPLSAGLEQFTAAISAAPSVAPPPVVNPPAPIQPEPPAASAFTGFASAMDPFAPAGESSRRAGEIQAGFSSFDLMGGADAPQPTLFPEAAGPAAFIPTEVPEIPTTVEKPTLPEAPTVPSTRAPSWAAFTQQMDAPEPQQPIESAPPVSEQPAPVPPEEAEHPFFRAAPEPTSPAAQPQSQVPMFRAPTSPRPSAAAKSSMGLSAISSGAEEQLMLRALLDTDEELTIARVMELTVGLPGITACALIKGEQVLAGESTKGSDARAFRTQAAEVARSLRTLAPLIGIADAETFTLNTDSRLITLCFPGSVTLGILHDREPSLGLRDKLTLIARQLERMVAQD